VSRGPRSVAVVRGDLEITRAFTPERTGHIAKLEAELEAAKAAVKARARVSKGILSATHVKLADGWVEVVRIDSADAIVVKNGDNRSETVRLRDVHDIWGEQTTAPAPTDQGQAL